METDEIDFDILKGLSKSTSNGKFIFIPERAVSSRSFVEEFCKADSAEGNATIVAIPSIC